MLLTICSQRLLLANADRLLGRLCGRVNVILHGFPLRGRFCFGERHICIDSWYIGQLVQFPSWAYWMVTVS